MKSINRLSRISGLLLRLLPLWLTVPAFAGGADLLSEYRAEDWIRVPLGKTKQLDVHNPWHFDAASGVLRCEGAGVHEMLLHRTPRGDGVLRVEWRFPGAPTKGNSGVFVATTLDGATWLQGQLALTAPGTLFGIDANQLGAPRKLAAGERQPALVRPNAEWNLMEITCRGATVSLRLNGVEVASVPNAPVGGYVGLEAEGSLIEFRRMEFLPLPADTH